MGKFKQLIKWILLLCLFLTAAPVGVFASDLADPKLKNSVAMLVDGKNGRVLYESTDEKLYEIGSITKLLSVYLVYQAIEEGALSPDKPVALSEEAVNLSQDYDISNVPLRVDFEYSPSELIESVAVSLANGSTLALAETVSGSEEKFVQLMEKQLDDWGLTGQYELYNATGLPTEYKPFNPDTIEKGSVNKMTIEAVSVVAYHLVNEYPEYLDYSKQAKSYFKPDTEDKFEMLNYNLLVPGRPYAYELADGLMSASSKRDGASLVATAQQDDLRLISVIMGADLEDGSEYDDGEKLLKYGFNTFSTEKVVSKGQAAGQIGRQPVVDGAKNWADVVYSSDYYWVGVRGDTALRVTYEFEPDQNKYQDEMIKAPLEKGSTIGKVEIIPREDIPARFLPSSSKNYVAVEVNQDIPKANSFQRVVNNMSRWGQKVWSGIRRFFINIFN